MARLPTPGLRSRLLLALGLVMLGFIALTELSVSQLTKVAISHVTQVARADVTGAEQTAALEDEARNLRRLTLFYFGTGTACVLLLAAGAITLLVIRPLRRINRALTRVAEGELETQIPVTGSAEMIAMGSAFNRMTAELRAQRERLTEQMNTLERSSINLKEAQDRLIRAAKLASVGTLAAGVAHEIGNPLTGVLGLLEALDGERDPDKQARYRELMQTEIRRIDRIISDLLAYARPAQSASDTDAPAADVEEVLGDIRPLLEAQSVFDGVTLEATLEGGPWRVAIGRDALKQVLLNLLLNAAQAIDGSGLVVVSCEGIDSWRPGLGVVSRPAIRIAVTDDGQGIDAQTAERIFDPFYSQRPGGGGTGLGLAICQSLCDRAGGEIELERSSAEGSRFVITLPRAND